MRLEKLDLENRTYISPDQSGMWYFVQTKTDDLAACLLMVDKDGNGYFTDISREEIASLFRGWQEALVKQSFMKGETNGNG